MCPRTSRRTIHFLRLIWMRKNATGLKTECGTRRAKSCKDLAYPHTEFNRAAICCVITYRISLIMELLHRRVSNQISSVMITILLAEIVANFRADDDLRRCVCTAWHSDQADCGPVCLSPNRSDITHAPKPWTGVLKATLPARSAHVESSYITRLHQVERRWVILNCAALSVLRTQAKRPVHNSPCNCKSC